MLPFQCEVCLKSFKYNSLLKKHSVVHSVEKQYCCQICGVKLARNDVLKKHMKAKHQEFDFSNVELT